MKNRISFYFPFFLVFYEISTYLSNDMYLPAMPAMMRDLNMSTRLVQLTVSMWLVGSAALPLVAGVMADRFGRRPTLLWGGLVYIAASVVCALSVSVHDLLWGRFLQGAATPTMLVAGYATIHESYEQKEAIRLLALMGSMTILAPAFGPLFGSWILTMGSWRDIFWVIVLWAGIGVGCLYFTMPETRQALSREPLHLGKLYRQYANIVGNKQFLLLICALGFLFAGFIVWISAGSLLTINTFHYTSVGYGVLQAIAFAFYILGNRCVKPLMTVLRVPVIVAIGMGLALAGGLLLVGVSWLMPAHLYPFMAAFSLFALGTALCFPTLNRTIIETSDEPMGVRVSVFTVAWMLFGVIGSLAAGHLFDGTMLSLASPIAAAAVLGCLLYYLAWRAQQHTRTAK